MRNLGLAEESMKEAQSKFAFELDSFEDAFDQYDCLLNYAATLPCMSEDAKEQATLVDGCMSNVWVACSLDGEGLLAYSLDSDTLIVRGILYMLQRIFNGHTPQEAAAFEFTLLQDTGLIALFSSERQSGFKSILALMKSMAATAETAQEACHE